MIACTSRSSVDGSRHRRGVPRGYSEGPGGTAAGCRADIPSGRIDVSRAARGRSARTSAASALARRRSDYLRRSRGVAAIGTVSLAMPRRRWLLRSDTASGLSTSQPRRRRDRCNFRVAASERRTIDDVRAERPRSSQESARASASRCARPSRPHLRAASSAQRRRHRRPLPRPARRPTHRPARRPPYDVYGALTTRRMLRAISSSRSCAEAFVCRCPLPFDGRSHRTRTLLAPNPSSSRRVTPNACSHQQSAPA